MTTENLPFYLYLVPVILIAGALFFRDRKKNKRND